MDWVSAWQGRVGSSAAVGGGRPRHGVRAPRATHVATQGLGVAEEERGHEVEDDHAVGGVAGDGAGVVAQGDEVHVAVGALFLAEHHGVDLRERMAGRG